MMLSLSLILYVSLCQILLTFHPSKRIAIFSLRNYNLVMMSNSSWEINVFWKNFLFIVKKRSYIKMNRFNFPAALESRIIFTVILVIKLL